MQIGGDSFTIKPIFDKRLTRNLNIDEFTVAFNKYKNVMCNTYPSRRKELDQYHTAMIHMSQQYEGSAFYDYHKMFSLRASHFLLQENQKVDWAIRDTELYQSVFTGRSIKKCGICSSSAHLTNFCPERATDNPQRSAQSNNKSTGAGPKGSDRRGRVIVKDIDGKPICNNFNATTGCLYGADCKFQHICLNCKLAHPRFKCNTVKGANQTNPKVRSGNPPGKPIPSTY
jgi:hypothetical protein